MADFLFMSKSYYILKIRIISYLFLFLLINSIFIIKYGSRQNFISIEIALFFYLISIASILLIINYYDKFTKPILRYLFVFFAIFLVIIANYLVDPMTLNVDRWSAMEVGIKALLNGEYPYTATDHMNGRTSNLPGLMLIGLPFYLMNDVGLLQVFTFLLFSFFTLQVLPSAKEKILSILLLLMSPSFFWEVIVKSDLMSNIFLGLLFIIIIRKKIESKIPINPFGLGLITSLLLMTRIVVFIPITLLLFHFFTQQNLVYKLKLILSIAVGIFLLISMVLINCPSLEILKEFNPLNLQSHYTPTALNLIVLILPIFLSHKIKNVNSLLFFSLLVMAIPIIYSFINVWYQYGMKSILINSSFDISYLGMLIPFLVILIPLNKDFKTIK